VTLTFEVVTKKINRGHLIVMTNQYQKYEDFVINSFQDKMETILPSRTLWPCLWPSDQKINRGHSLLITNHYVKYEVFVINKFQDNKSSDFSRLIGNCMILKKISIGKRPFFGVCYISRKITEEETILTFKAHLTLTFELETP
jgi:hypothetical protein